MRICYFGIYKPTYPRNRNIILGLKKAGAEVIEVNDRSAGFKKFVNLYKKHKLVANQYDVMIVGFSGQLIMPFARLITRKPIVFDAHVSLYDSEVVERKKVSPYSLRGILLWCLDWVACRLARLVLLDTNEHCEYVSKLLHIRRSKFHTVYHGVDDELYQPLKRSGNHDNFIIEFHGLITPTNGMDLVIHAMKLLEADTAIQLWIIGGGSEYENIKTLALDELHLQSVTFFPFTPPAELVKKIADVDLGLGFFKITSGRVRRVIPNKVYELMALKIPVLTADTAGMHEQFKHGVHAYLVPTASPEAIAEAIRQLKSNPELREQLANNAYRHMKASLIPEMVGQQLINEMKNQLKITA